MVIMRFFFKVKLTKSWKIDELMRERETIIVNYELMMVSKRFRKIYYKCDMSSLFPC